MELYVIVVIFVCILLSLSQSQRYRFDYEYSHKTDAFYKFHVDMMRVGGARDACRLEGAQLMVPSSHLDVVQAHAMFKRYPDLKHAWVDNDGHTHESEEQTPIIDLTLQNDDYRDLPYRSECDVVTAHTGEVQSHDCYARLPFICKVEARRAYYDSQCQVYGRNYTFVANVRSCYKASRIAVTWNQAYDDCDAEGSHLVIINSDVEKQVVEDIIKAHPSVEDARFQWFYYVGFRANKPNDGSQRVFRTIFNETLEEAGYNKWAEHEPNNYGDQEYCGSIFKNDGKFNDVNCMERYAFVCEKEVVTNN